MQNQTPDSPETTASTTGISLFLVIAVMGIFVTIGAIALGFIYQTLAGHAVPSFVGSVMYVGMGTALVALLCELTAMFTSRRQ
jgi:hypothetical protein